MCTEGKAVTLMAAFQRGPSKPSRSDSRSGERGDQERPGCRRRPRDVKNETDKRNVEKTTREKWDGSGEGG